MIVKFDHLNKKARVCLKGEQILEEMDRREHEEGENRTSLWRPEFGAYMVEGTPGKPYEINALVTGLASFNLVEDNMKLRRMEIQTLLDADEALLCLTSFPRSVVFRTTNLVCV
mgnify:CR=1 FL=1